MHWLAQTADDTEAFGAQLARSRPADTALAVVYLSGELGAGKTTLARGYLHASGVEGIVRSPTYTLLEAYETSEGPVVHLDLYRLQQPSELETLGVREWAAPGHTWLVEWPERGAGLLPVPDLTVTLTTGSPAHRINVSAASPSGTSWLAALTAALGSRPPLTTSG